ncbi:MAG: HlyD family efflux transporter periplasmic adaptor subunit, partial [Deltaproteobacteria bacterium]|nr:HlyD family efflux transporter periplasmic adaptor subunit [Deltaproteobacteria bacterium]
AQVQHQAVADAKTVFRPEALSASRSRHRAGELVHLSPRWIRIALPAILAMGALLITLAAIIQVPSYSRGTVVVRMNGHNVISNAQGRIAEILVAPGQRVAAGDRLIVLDTTQEQQAFAQVDTVFRDQLGAFLVDPTDEGARQSLAGILASHTSARDTLATKTITAPIDGVVGAILASDIVSAGEHVLTIIPRGSEPSVIAFMPGSDLARIKVGMVLQVEMTGYTHKRAQLVITEVGDEVISQTQARKQLGQKLADAVPLPPSTVMIKAKLTSPSFEAQGKTYDYRDGMDGLGEIEVDTRSFLAMVIRTGD